MVEVQGRPAAWEAAAGRGPAPRESYRFEEHDLVLHYDAFGCEVDFQRSRGLPAEYLPASAGSQS